MTELRAELQPLEIEFGQLANQLEALERAEAMAKVKLNHNPQRAISSQAQANEFIRRAQSMRLTPGQMNDLIGRSIKGR